jgi:hypothetical protein
MKEDEGISLDAVSIRSWRAFTPSATVLRMMRERDRSWTRCKSNASGRRNKESENGIASRTITKKTGETTVTAEEPRNSIPISAT